MSKGRWLGSVVRIACVVLIVAGWGLGASSATAKPSVVTDPPVGTEWTDTATLSPGTTGALTANFSAKITQLTTTNGVDWATFTFSYVGQLSFLSSTPCGQGQIPVPAGTIAATIKRVQASGTVTQIWQGNLNNGITYGTCQANVNPPPNFQTAVSYVRYDNVQFTLPWLMAMSVLGEPGRFDFNVRYSMLPDVARMVDGSIAFPGIVKSSPTTTTTKKTTTTSSTTTSVVDTTVPAADTTVPTSDTTDGGGVVPVVSSTTTLSPTTTVETVEQAKERRAETTESAAVTVVAAAVAATTLLPAVTAMGVAGAAGAAGAVGLMTGRVLSGPGLLPGSGSVSAASVGPPAAPSVTPRSEVNVDVRTGDNRIVDKGPGEVRLSNENRTAQDVAPGDGARGGIVTTFGMFSFLVKELQWISRVRVLRPGIKRLTEVAVLSPHAALALQLVPLIVGSLVSWSLYSGGIDRMGWSLVGLLVVCVASPWLGLLGVSGWFLGCTFTTGSPLFATAESLAMTAGLVLLPMAVRSLLGPRGRSRDWETGISFIAVPIVAMFMFRSWMNGLGSTAKTIAKAFKWLGLPAFNESTHLYVRVGTAHAVVATGAVLLVALSALWTSDRHGNPKYIFTSTHGDHPQVKVRRLFVERSTIHLGEPTKWSRWLRQVIAVVLTFVFLREIVGVWALPLVVFFFVGVRLMSRLPRGVGMRGVHPAVKAVPMLLLGQWIGSHSAAADSAVVPFFGVAAIVLLTLLVRTRPLWD